MAESKNTLKHIEGSDHEAQKVASEEIECGSNGQLNTADEVSKANPLHII